MSQIEKVAAEIRKGIFSGDLKPGEALRQESLAKSLGVSRMPVRDALTLLQAEGLVMFEPNHGVSVTPLSIDAAREAFAMREALEPIALEAAFDRQSRADLGAAEDAIAFSRQANSTYDLAKSNWDFHHSLYKAAPYPFLLTTLKALHQTATRYQLIGQSIRLRSAASETEHLELLMACRDRDRPAALQLLKRHLKFAAEILLDEITSLNSTDSI